MESLQEQVVNLSVQIDNLYLAIERLNGQVALLLQRTQEGQGSEDNQVAQKLTQKSHISRRLTAPAQSPASSYYPVIHPQRGQYLPEASFDKNHREPTHHEIMGDNILDMDQDVLIDDSFGDDEEHPRERFLGPELQVQRLTAQLTAAYNRIASLEEQLLSQRPN